MILGAVDGTEGGAEALNECAVGQLRERFVAREAREWVSELRSADGSLQTVEAVRVTMVAAELLAQLDHICECHHFVVYNGYGAGWI